MDLHMALIEADKSDMRFWKMIYLKFVNPTTDSLLTIQFMISKPSVLAHSLIRTRMHVA